MRRPGGFTLLEMLVVLVVFGLLLVGLHQGARVGIASGVAQMVSVRRTAPLALAEARLRQVIEQAVPMGFDGLPGGLALRSRGPAGGAADVAVGLEGASLVLRWAPRPAGSGVAREVVLAEGVDHVALAFWRAGAPGAWLDRWPGPGLPALVRIRLVFPAGDARHWPDIVVAPLLDGPELDERGE